MYTINRIICSLQSTFTHLISTDHQIHLKIFPRISSKCSAQELSESNFLDAAKGNWNSLCKTHAVRSVLFGI